MTSPNIANLSTITGVTSTSAGIGSTTYTSVVSNPASSNTVLKLNTLIASNRSASASNLTVLYFSSASAIGSSVSIASTISIPSGSSLTLIAKDTPIYIEENRSIGAIGIPGGTIDIIASYETIQ
jgi:hypothetical protein